MSPRRGWPCTAYVGIDWADMQHDIGIEAAGDLRRESSCMAHRGCAMDEWLNALRPRFGRPMAATLELANRRCAAEV
ncbi:hypothetical protein LJR029_005924 [Caballeronia sp. LjRoot29]|uniref:hypothetical protein n=1 Tax=Caballeronia sp. LjRoot29 TaxID=3342315 RepID=UPI003ECE8B4E